MNNPVITRHRHETRRRTLRVRKSHRLTPHMIRIELQSNELADFVSLGFDDHIKLFFPNGSEKPLMRDYTPRAFDNDANTLTLDFAVHQAGPATDWAINAKPGDCLEIGGPRGSAVITPVFDWWLLIGDETALPAIGRCIENLPRDAHSITLCAVLDACEEQSFDALSNVESFWTHRPEALATDAEPLLELARNLEFPKGDGFIWIAAEAGVARALKNYFLNLRSHSREHIKASGYWVKGAAATSDKAL